MNEKFDDKNVGKMSFGKTYSIGDVRNSQVVQGENSSISGVQYNSGNNNEGDKILGDKIENQSNNFSDLVQASKDIKALLNQLSLDYPQENPRVLGAKAVDQLRSDPNLQSRVLRGVKAGSFAALEKMIDHPVAQFFIEGTKEILKP